MAEGQLLQQQKLSDFNRLMNDLQAHIIDEDELMRISFQLFNFSQNRIEKLRAQCRD